MSDIVIREATAADNDALVDLERRSPVLLGKSRLVVDRSPNFFARRELQEQARVLVAERDGRLAGVMAVAWYQTLVGGEPVQAVYVHHGRVAVEHQRSGVGTALWRALLEPLLPTANLVYWYVLPENQVSLNLMLRVSRRQWPISPAWQRFPLEASAPAGAALSPARPAQIGELCDLINRTHAGRDLFMPYTEERLAARLSRSAAYVWPQLFVRERAGRLVAAAGLWDLGATYQSIRIDEAGRQTAARPAVVLDYGFAEGQEGEMAALLDALGRWARSQGLGPSGSTELAEVSAEGRQEPWTSIDPESRLYRSLKGRPHVSGSCLAFSFTANAPLPGKTATPYLDFVYW